MDQEGGRSIYYGRSGQEHLPSATSRKRGRDETKLPRARFRRLSRRARTLRDRRSTLSSLQGDARSATARTQSDTPKGRQIMARNDRSEWQPRETTRTDQDRTRRRGHAAIGRSYERKDERMVKGRRGFGRNREVSMVHPAFPSGCRGEKCRSTARRATSEDIRPYPCSTCGWTERCGRGLGARLAGDERPKT